MYFWLERTNRRLTQRHSMLPRRRKIPFVFFEALEDRSLLAAGLTVELAPVPDDHGNDSGAATPIAVGTSTSGKIEPAQDVDWFRFHAISGAIYTLRTELGTLVDSTLTLLAADGVTQLAFDDDSGGAGASLLSWQASSEQDCFAVVAAFGVLTGSYQLVLSVDDHGDDAASATLVGVPSTTAGVIQPGDDVDWFEFEAESGTTYTLMTVLQGLVDSTLALYASDGVTQIDFNDDDPARGLASRITWTAPAAGIYYLEVASSDFTHGGQYSLVVASPDDHGNDAASSTPLAIPSNAAGDLESSGDVDWFAFTARQGTAYIFQDRKSTRLNSSHIQKSRMPSSA